MAHQSTVSRALAYVRGGKKEAAHLEYDCDPAATWERNLWLDETKIVLFVQSSKHCVWHKPETSLALRASIPTVKFSGGSLMQCKCFSSAGSRHLLRTGGRMNGAEKM